MRAKTYISVAGLTALGVLASGCGLFSSGSKPTAAAVAATSDAPSPTPAATPGTDATTAGTDPASDAATSQAGGSSMLGAVASDDATPLTTFPSLAAIAKAFGTAEHIKTTIEPRYQNAAATALTDYPQSGMVVIQPSTGHVLAIASRGGNMATQGELAPGSTFKVITTEDLLRNGLTANSSMPCTASVPGYAKVKNDSARLTKPSADLTYAFTQSCNTSFVNKLSTIQNSPLSAESTKYFGLNQPWDLGIGPATYGTQGKANVPQATGDYFAAEMFGQGDITVSPLNMASVAATVASGRFKQPVLVDGWKATASATPLNSDVDATLKKLMQETVTDGTATSLRGLGNGIGAKTGTAEPGGDGPNNSWMIAFRGDVAVACVVQGGNFGDESAGPAIKAMLTAADAKQ